MNEPNVHKGYCRKGSGTGFAYFNEAGQHISAPRILSWIKALAIPPAWNKVWISKDRHAYLLATGYDDRGRKQYIYHPDWEDVREAKKFKRLKRLSGQLVPLRKNIRQFMSEDTLTRERVLASVVTIIDTTGVRVGNTRYQKENDTYGITTVRKKHVAGENRKTFRYLGKGAKLREFAVTDPAVVDIISECEELPGYQLFKYIDDKGEKHDVSSDEINDFIREQSGVSATAKDLRTWHGNVAALESCKELGICEKHAVAAHRKKIFTEAAKMLGNTPTIAAESYVFPKLVELHCCGEIEYAKPTRSKYVTAEEVTLRNLLQRYV
ncbi:DNA topoisomerase IB [Candidatus Pacebacteria bacterium]|nr:DNA topoisomerase IB [Candidatus Paceibacterota bacterium]